LNAVIKQDTTCTIETVMRDPHAQA
jgi:hypothetical protein